MIVEIQHNWTASVYVFEADLGGQTLSLDFEFSPAMLDYGDSRCVAGVNIELCLITESGAELRVHPDPDLVTPSPMELSVSRAAKLLYSQEHALEYTDDFPDHYKCGWVSGTAHVTISIE